MQSNDDPNAVHPLSPDNETTRDAEEGPNDPHRPRRLDWAKLLKRVFAADVLSCPRCEGLMRPVAVIDDERIARQILTHLGLPARAPPRGRTRTRTRPGQLELADACDAYEEGTDPPLVLD